MKQKINIRLVFLSLLVTVLSTIAVTIVYYSLFQEQVKKDLKIEAMLLSSSDMSDLMLNNSIQFNKDIRITWINENGDVLFDNDVNEEKLANHLNRPEVVDALNNGTGESVRNSDTMNMRTFYYAVLMNDGTVLRVATEARSIYSVFFSALPVIMIIIIIIVIICIIISNMLTKQLLQPIKDMADNIDNNVSVSGYKELEPFMERIREQHEDILAAARRRQDFTANVSHELKTPLTAISGYAELIENHMVDEEQAIHFSTEIRRNADRLVTLINDIIKLSELDQKENSPDFTNIDIYDVVQDRLDMLRSNAREKNVEINLHGNRCSIYANKDMMIELIDNLVQNAIRYNVNDGKVDITIKDVDNHVRITIADTGIGIPVSEQSKVFERFYRVDKGRSRESGGTGLGLAIVKHIVELHEGSITLESEPGKGTCITVTI